MALNPLSRAARLSLRSTGIVTDFSALRSAGTSSSSGARILARTKSSTATSSCWCSALEFPSKANALSLPARNPRGAQSLQLIARWRPSLSLPKSASSARHFHASRSRNHGGITRPAPGTGIKLTFRDSKGADIRTVEVNEGDDLLSIAHEYDIDLEGACEGSIACSTCHVILEPEVYDKLEEPGDDENDMLDLAFGLTDTSRLGCQVKVTKELDGMVAQLPAATRNMYVDGHKAGHGH